MMLLPPAALLALAQRLGWPSMRIPGGPTFEYGEEAWRAFVARATVTDRAVLHMELHAVADPRFGPLACDVCAAPTLET